MNFIWNLKGPQMTKIIFKKINEAEGLTLDDFKTYFEAIGFKTM